MVGYGGKSVGFPKGLNPSPMITTFPQASLRSRRVGFPESGSDLGATPRSPSQEKRSLSVDPHTPHPSLVYFQGHSIVHRPYVLLVRLLLKPPSAQSPFTHSRCYLSRRGCFLHVRGRYPAVIATTGSCANPKPSRRLRSKPWSAGLCRLQSTPAGHRTFPAFLPRICPQMPGPLPRRSPWCAYSFLPTEHRPSPFPNRVGTPQNPGQRLQSGD